jgi:hypothetical protein
MSRIRKKESASHANQVSTANNANHRGVHPDHAGLGFQRSLGHQAVGDTGSKSVLHSASSSLAVPAIVHEALRSPGEPLDSSTRQSMESRFGHDFSSVRIKADGQAAVSADAVNARAYTVGRQVVFGRGQYAPATISGQHLLAHELAHVVQQEGQAPSFQSKPLLISVGEDSSERKADAAADSILHGLSMPDVGRARPNTVQRAVKTFGGSFDTREYVAINDAKWATKKGVGKTVGANIHLKFTPNDLVEADNIGLVQTVKTLRNKKAGGAADIPSNARTSTLPDALEQGEGDLGRGIDQLAYVNKTKIPQTNPLYAVTNTKTVTSKSLTDVMPVAAHDWGGHGSHKKKADGTFEPATDAELKDKPRRTIAFAQQIWTQIFEVAALVLDGPMANTYLGSVAWGWETDDTGTATLNPASIELVQGGVPSLGFRQASEKWNRLTFKGPGKKKFETVDLPVPSDLLDSGLQHPSDRETPNLLSWLKMLDFQISVLKDEIKDATTPEEKAQKQLDLTNKEFEKRAIQDELKKRNANP